MATATETRTATELISHIVNTHHAYLRRELPFFEERLAKMTANHGKERPELFRVQQIILRLRDELLPHLEKEELVLFPYIQDMERALAARVAAAAAPFPSVRFPVRMMMMEHDGAEGLLESLREATGNFSAPDGLCDCGREFYTRLAGLDTDLREHIRLENDVLFPRAIELEEAAR